MSESEVPMSETVTLGRADYGWGVTAETVTVEGEPFAVYNGRYYSPCGYCTPEWSGTKSWATHVYSGVCFQCRGRGWHRAYDDREAVVRLVKRRVADRARRERKEAERMAAQDKARDDWREANPEVAAMLAEVYAAFPTTADPDYDDTYEEQRAARDAWGPFLSDVAMQAQWRPLSEKQTAAVPAAYERAKAEQAAKAAKETASRWYGDVKAKVTGTGTVTVATTVDGYYGASRLVVVEGSGEFEGVTFKMFGTGQSLWDTGRGDVVEVTGTVKDHDEYEGVKQTVLTRTKVKVLTAAEDGE